jgi:hypothetical protein
VNLSRNQRLNSNGSHISATRGQCRVINVETTIGVLRIFSRALATFLAVAVSFSALRPSTTQATSCALPLDAATTPSSGYLIFEVIDHVFLQTGI